MVCVMVFRMVNGLEITTEVLTGVCLGEDGGAGGGNAGCGGRPRGPSHSLKSIFMITN